MNKTLKLKTYSGQPFYYIVEDVENLLCLVCYTVSGDECAMAIYKDGDFALLDSGDDADETRLMSFGPEDVNVLLPQDIEWEPEHYEA